MIMLVIGFWAHPIGLFVIFVSKLSLPVVHYVLINLCCIMPFERYGAFERSWGGGGVAGKYGLRNSILEKKTSKTATHNHKFN